ncbi:flagellar biosynthesis protein FlgA [Saccharopolyspora hirsuta]|uniref:Flagellar biosynthesis protein FlgA n=1 Tax=Saccharopolyspora hirsuta TaxID=1837 RepID=A0A5M7BZK8_SACHI|nr:SAF domain-containing protein [Saccharopolyspora hirsuta]KAA5835219.1 flagellar biosynthesis protein FlgA [Saccharopolyspora hirsuta]
MNLHRLLVERNRKSGPIKVGVIGAGKFSSMFLTQALHVPGLHLVGVADLSPDRARTALARTGWPSERYAAASFGEALRTGGTHVTDSADDLIDVPGLEVVLEITGDPIVGTHHAVRAIDAGRHVVMVNVEADCLVGPLLAERARRAGVVYTMAYGDQPALICELVDWCRTVGFDVVAAGKGTKYLPEYRSSTPDTVWDHYGFTAEQLASGDYNPKMFNSFLDGTKSAIEMAAVANGTGLQPQDEGLLFPPVGVDDLATALRPGELGGSLTRRGTVEVVSSLERDGTEVDRDLRWGVYVTFEARTDYAVQCFAEYGVRTDPTGRYGALYRPYHMIGLELGISIASAVLRGEPTGAPDAFRGDVVAVAKRDLRAGEVLDGEGGFTVHGELTPARASLAADALPIGLAHGCRLVNDVPAGAILSWADADLDDTLLAVKLRRELQEG